MRFGQEEAVAKKTPPSGPSQETLLKNEMYIQLKLDSLHIDLYSVMKRSLNFVLGTRSLAYKKWASIKEDIKTTPLIPEARRRLAQQHKLFEDWVTPKPFSLLKALAPLLVLWLAKGFWSSKMQERGIDKFLKKKRTKQRLKQKEAKEKRRKEKEGVNLTED